MRAYGRMEVKLHVSLISVLDVGGWLVSRIWRFTSRNLRDRKREGGSPEPLWAATVPYR
jgi:hypothetical protein